MISTSFGVQKWLPQCSIYPSYGPNQCWTVVPIVVCYPPHGSNFSYNLKNTADSWVYSNFVDILDHNVQHLWENTLSSYPQHDSNVYLSSQGATILQNTSTETFDPNQEGHLQISVLQWLFPYHPHLWDHRLLLDRTSMWSYVLPTTFNLCCCVIKNIGHPNQGILEQARSSSSNNWWKLSTNKLISDGLVNVLNWAQVQVHHLAKTSPPHLNHIMPSARHKIFWLA